MIGAGEGLADSGSDKDNFARVNQVPPDDDLSYVAKATPGHRDVYAIAPLGSAPLAIQGLQQTARKDGASERGLALVLKSGAAVDIGLAALVLLILIAVARLAGIDLARHAETNSGS